MQNRGDKKNKVPEPKLIKVKELKDASVQIEEMIKKEDRVQTSVGTSQK